MGRIVLDRRGDLQKSIFYRFDVPFDDATDTLKRKADWIVVSRTPTDDELQAKNQPTYLWLEPWLKEEDREVTKACKRDAAHVTHHFQRRVTAEVFGGIRQASFVPTTSLGEVFALSAEFYDRVKRLKLKGARLDKLEIIFDERRPQDPKIWALQFVGHSLLRLPEFVECTNSCPYCGKGKYVCESCGFITPNCSECGKHMVVLGEAHGGKEDQRLFIEEDLWRIVEGKTWDGTDLFQASTYRFASKRFIDWLLRVHAAPFYAEPVWFCVDGMSEDQQRWLKELEKPLEE